MPPHSDPALARWTREHWLVAGLGAFVASAIIAIVPGFSTALAPSEAAPSEHLLSVALPLPPVRAEEQAGSSGWQFVRVRSGQTLGTIFDELKLSATLMHRMLDATSAAAALTRLKVGQELGFELDSDGQLRRLRFNSDDAHRVELQVNGDRVTESVQARQVDHRVAVASGTISSSLYADGARAGLSTAAINDMANIFKYDIDFVQDLRDGDSFQVVYDETWVDGQPVSNGGDIVAATFYNRGKRYTAFRFNHDGKDEYFDETGRPLKKTLLRIPVEFTRISSRFSLARMHPILGRMRAHKGVDYAAPTGTPIMAAGDGKVAFVGWKNGYGRVVVIDHGQGRSTLYGHMSAWGREKVGQRVAQGQTIGYVGMSGLATGPHLHYEFRVGGTPVNPLSVTMPKPEPLRGAEMARFRAETAPALAKLQLAEKNARVAMR